MPFFLSFANFYFENYSNSDLINNSGAKMGNFEIFRLPNPDTGTNYEFAGPLMSDKTAI